MTVPTRRILDPIYGSPILRAANNGSATWAKVNTSSQWQKGTGWQASLYGGVQTGDDWGAIFIPTLEQKVTDFNSAQWSYYMTATQTMGVNLVIWVHNPNNFNQRAEITQLGNTALLGKTLGWNSHTLLKTTDQFAWYGEDWSGGSAAALTGSGLTSGTQYGWDDFQADALFKNWTIYRISLEYGWEASGTFDYVWVVEAKLNGQVIPFLPSLAEIFAADTALAKVTLLANTGVDIGDVDILSIAAGTNLIGKVGIDQTTPGTTNKIAVDGTKETAISQETGAVGAIGWLSSIKGFLANLVTRMGEVQASPTANTVLGRLDEIEAAIDEINVLIGEVQASPTENSLLERQKAIETALTAINTLIGAVTDSPTENTLLERLKALETTLLTLVVLGAGTNRIGQVSGTLKEVRVAQVIDGSLGAYAAGDVVGADDCCTTLAVAWEFDVARVAGGYGYIVGATLVNETENQAVQYDMLVFNATPTGELRDNAANTNPVKADRSKYLGTISFPYSVAKGATVATYTQATPSTVGNLPLAFKCAAEDTKIYTVLVTNTAYTQTATDDIEITLEIDQY